MLHMFIGDIYQARANFLAQELSPSGAGSGVTCGHAKILSMATFLMDYCLSHKGNVTAARQELLELLASTHMHRPLSKRVRMFAKMCQLRESPTNAPADQVKNRRGGQEGQDEQVMAEEVGKDYSFFLLAYRSLTAHQVTTKIATPVAALILLTQHFRISGRSLRYCAASQRM